MRIHGISVLGAAWLLGACGQEISVNSGPPVDVAKPPGKEENLTGDPPDWQNCYQGWRGVYSNLTVDNPYVTPRPNDEPAPTDPTVLDWWSSPAFEKYDATLDFGQNYWPVDDGLEGDPAYFAVYWHAWIRAWSDTTLTFALGSSDDSWVYVNDAPIAEKPGIQPFVRDTFDVYLDAGQYPIEVFYAHRASDVSGFSFRVLSGDVSICYPDFEPDAPQ